MKAEETLSAATHRAREIEREISDFERLRGGDTTKPQATKTDQRTNIRMVEALQISATGPQKEGNIVVCQLLFEHELVLFANQKNLGRERDV